MEWWENRYVCPGCREMWISEWSSICDDECAGCGMRDIAPVESTNLSVIVEAINQRTWGVFAAVPRRKDGPHYHKLGEIEIDRTDPENLKFRPAP